MSKTAAMIGKPRRDINRIAICIATMRRPVGLLRLLRELDKQQFRKHPRPELVIIVCDNDSDQSALEPVRAFGKESAFPVRYVHEPQRGISFARNSCIRAAREEGSDALAFIDDDETPAHDWLDELLVVRRQFDAHVVTGPVRPDYEDGVSRWMIEAGFFERPNYESGTPMSIAATNNVLVVREVIDAVGLFDGRLALSGGEDSHFFWRAHAAGAVIVWSSTAVVHETVPLSRARIEWVVRRACRLQNSYVFCERELLPVSQWMPRRIAKIFGFIARGTGRILIAPIVGRAMFVRGLCDVARVVGATAAVCGALHYEYRTIHGQ